MLPIKHNFAKNIKLLRKKSGFTQAQLADKLEVSPSTIGMYEQGRRKPDQDTLSKMCEILGSSSDFLLGLENDDAQKTEIYNVISNFIENLEKQNNLMFNGEPINPTEKKKITSALKVATAITLSDITPQKPK